MSKHHDERYVQVLNSVLDTSKTNAIQNISYSSHNKNVADTLLEYDLCSDMRVRIS